jgi:quercetin dioxygenase-like cupin family protein
VLDHLRMPAQIPHAIRPGKSPLVGVLANHIVHDLDRQRAASGKRYLEFIRVAAMSIGIYVLPKGGVDPQKPHHEDEVYYVVKGRAKMQIGSDHANVKAGSIIFVEAELEHRFYYIEEELEVPVFFAPAEME